MQFGVLGPLLVQDARGPVPLASAKQRALLAILLLETPHVVPSGRLIDELWGDDPPPTAAKALQVHVSQLRRTLGTEQPIVTLPSGYALHIDRSALDLHRFDALLAKARRLRTEGDLDGALASLQVALGLWRGPPLADVKLFGPGAHEAVRLEGLCAVAQEERMEIELARGGGGELVPELEGLIAADPYREHMHALLMLALYRAGRQADALEVFQRARQLLTGELGLEPGPELARLQTAILAQDSTLDVPPAPQASRAQPDPLRGLATPGSDLPRRLTVPRPAATILGRERELAAAIELIEDPEVRLLTLTGAGGIGKTRLALELAAGLPDRSCFVELAAVREPHQVIAVVAATIGTQTASPEGVAQALGNEPAVLFLDNFEQVLSAAPSITALLEALPSLKLVITSRAALRIAGEHELAVPPLARASAVELFVRRIHEQDPGFSPSEEDLEQMAAICARIDNLPLAIELAAARTRVLSLNEILDRIGHRLDLLTSGRRDAPERHRTLRATIDWSYELLDDEEQQLFVRLAAFPSGCSVDACEAVTRRAVLDTLSSLVEHCLVIRDNSRFSMLETVREYASELLLGSPQEAEIRRRQALWCLGLAEAAEHELEGPRQAEWFDRLELERENLRSAAAWAAANEEPGIVLGLGAALWRFWVARGAGDLRAELTAALATPGGDEELRIKALNAAGVLAGEGDDFASASEFFMEALGLADALHDRRQMARILMNLGVIALYTDDYETALSRYREAGEIWRELGDVRGQSVMCQNLAIVHESLGQVGQATPLLEQSVELARAAGDGMHVAQTLVELGKHLLQHRPGDARTPDLLREGLELASALGERRQTVECFEVLAALSARTGAPVTGAELIGAAEGERARSSIDRKPDELALVQATTTELSEDLGPVAYGRARARGRSRSLDIAVAVALKSTQREPRPARQKRISARRGLEVVTQD